MKKRDLFLGQSIAQRWLISYIVVSLITVFFNFAAYLKIDGSVAKQNEGYVKEMLENRKTDIDNFIRLASNVAIDISQKNSVKNLAFMDGELKDEKILLVHNVADDLDVYKKLETEFDNIYIYFYNIDYCVSLSGANYADVYFDTNIKKYGISKAEWLKTMRDKQNGKFASFSNDSQKIITHFYSVYSLERFVPYATIAIEVDCNKLLNSTSNPLYDGSFYLCTEDNTIVGDLGMNLDEIQGIIDEYGIEEGIRPIKNNKTMICVSSDNYNWKYFYLVDNSIFKKTINSARRNILLFNLIGILFMFVVARFVVKQNYNPLGRFIAAINGKQDGTISEYNEMTSKVISVINENKAMNHFVETLDNDFVRESLVTRLLAENLTEDERKKLVDSLKSVGIVFPYKHFSVFLISIDDNLDMFFDDYNDVEENYRLARVAMINIADEVFAGHCRLNYCTMNGALCCIANFKDDITIADLQKDLRWIKNFVTENFNISFTVGISSIHSRIDELAVCFDEALSCMKERLYSSSGIISYNELEEKSYTQFCLSDIKEGQILYHLRNSNPDAAFEIIDVLLNEKMSNGLVSVYSMKSLLYNLVIIITRAFGQNSAEFENRMTGVLRQLDTVSNKSEFEKVKKNIYSLIEYGCKQNVREITNRIDFLMKKAKEYVEENYSDINLSVTGVAQNIDVSLQYLSTNFKKNYKIGLAEYITNVRIEKAKELLVKTNKPISVIAEEVGYVNSRSFFRSFMKVVGTSPKGYRISESI